MNTLTYGLFDCVRERRLVIDVAGRIGWGERTATCEARCWLEAKYKLGLELTGLQTHLLELRGIDTL